MLDAVALALARLGLDVPAANTLVVDVDVVVALDRNALWMTWSDLPNWPRWSPVHRSASWVETPGWTVESRFDQTLVLGFPLGVVAQRAMIDRVEPARIVGWVHDHAEVVTSQVWNFTDVPEGGTRIERAEVWHGEPMIIITPMVALEWRRWASDAVTRLVELTANHQSSHRAQ